MGDDGPLRILCFHDEAQNPLVMAKHLEMFLVDDAPLLNHVELSYIQAPLVMEEMETAPEELSHCKIFGGEAHRWYTCGRVGDLRERREHLQESLDFASEWVRHKGPFDGLCGCGQGGVIVALLAKLASEGSAGLQGRFRFVICMNATWPRGRHWLPKVPLNFPSFQIFPISGPYPLSAYEHLALHFDASTRETIRHSEGYHMPRLSPAQSARMRRFLGRLRPSIPAPESDEACDFDLAEPSYASTTLPLRRISDQPQALTQGERVLAVCFHDLAHGRGGPEIFDEFVAKVSKHRDFRKRLVVDAPDLHQYVDLDGLGRPTPEEIAAVPGLRPEHLVSRRAAAYADAIVERFLQSDYRGMPVVIVGIGLGTYVGLQFAQALRVMCKVFEFRIDRRLHRAKVISRRPPKDPAAASSELLLEIVKEGSYMENEHRWARFDGDHLVFDDDVGSMNVPCKVVTESQGRPWWLFAIRPPVCFPAPTEQGSLGDCAVACLLEADDTGGDRWRWEMCSMGPYTTDVLADGSAETWTDMVMTYLRPPLTQSAYE